VGLVGVGQGRHVRLGAERAVATTFQEGDTRTDIDLVRNGVDGVGGAVVVGAVVVITEAVAARFVYAVRAGVIPHLGDGGTPEAEGEVGLAVAVEVANGNGVILIVGAVFGRSLEGAVAVAQEHGGGAAFRGCQVGLAVAIEVAHRQGQGGAGRGVVD